MRSHRTHLGFTLIELLASMAILIMMMVMLFSAFNQASKAWTQGENRVETFQQARAALDFISKELSQAIVTTNVPFLGNFNSLAYVAPVSDRSSDGADIAEISYRMSYKVPSDAYFSEDNNIWPKKLIRRMTTYTYASCKDYFYTSGGGCGPTPWDFYSNADWPETADPNRTAILAENIVAISFTYVSTNGILYPYWNSTENRGDPTSPGSVASYRPWQHEILGVASGIGFNDPDLGNVSNPGAAYMSNRAPIGVYVTIDLVDSKAAKRLLLMTNTVGFASSVWSNAMKQARQSFTTYVAIPNRQP